MSILLSLWLIWCLLGGVCLIFALKSMIKWLLAANNQAVEPDIDCMEGTVFENYLADLFADLGYRVQGTQKSHDYGADLILERDSTRIAVQAKWQSESVGLVAIQQVVAAKAMYDCAQAMVVTNNLYTQSALNLAQVNRVELWDRSILLRAMATRQARRRADKLRARAVHRISSLSAVLIAGVLLSCGFIGFWRQGFAALKLPLSTEPIANSMLNPPIESGATGVDETLEPTAGIISREGSALENFCGDAVVQNVAALAIRQSPSLHSEAVGEVPQGRTITLVCEPAVSSDGLIWQMVDYGMGRGWMSRKYLLVEQP